MKTYSIDKVALTSIAAIVAKTFKLDAIKLLKLVDLITEDSDQVEFTLPESEKPSKERIEEMVDELLSKLEGLTPEERKSIFSTVSKMTTDEDTEVKTNSSTKADNNNTKAKEDDAKKDEPSDKQYVFTAYCYAIPVAVRSTADKVLDCYIKGHGEIRPSDLTEEENKKILSYRSSVFSYKDGDAKKIFTSLVDRIRGSLICDRWRAAAV